MHEKLIIGGLARVTRDPQKPDKHPGFNDDMKKWLAGVVTIAGFFPGCKRSCCYRIVEDNGEFAWHKDWLKPIESLIRIEDDVATLYSAGGNGNYGNGNKKTCSIPNMIKSISPDPQSPKSQQTPILPIGTAYYSKGRINEVVVIEQEPHVRTLRWTNRGKSDVSSRNTKTYSLAFPYVVVICRIERGSMEYSEYPKCYYTTSPLRSLDDRLMHTNLQNVAFGSHWLCMHPETRGKSGDIAGQTYNLINELWNGVFTNNMSKEDDFHNSAQEIQAVKDVETWEKNSRKNPLFTLKTEWLDARTTLRQAVERALGSRGAEARNEIDSTEELIEILCRIEEAG